jgi:hypothetical protein
MINYVILKAQTAMRVFVLSFRHTRPIRKWSAAVRSRWFGLSLHHDSPEH